MYRCVWLWIAVYGYVGLCMAMYGCVWLCMAMYDYVWLGGGSWIIGSRLFVILCFFLQIIHYSFQFFSWYSLFIFLVFVSVFLCQIFYNAILYIVYQKFTFKYTFNLSFSKYHPIFSINVVKITLSFSIKRPSMQLLEGVREGPNNSSLITLSTKKK